MDKSISLEDNKIIIRFPYAPGLVSRVKEIPNARWDNNEMCWWLPATPIYAEHAKQLANEHQFPMENGVFQLLRQQVTQHRDKLYTFQKQAVDFIHGNNGTCLIADDMGLGKTIEALTYAKEIDAKRVLVVCPASVLYKWQDEIARWNEWDNQIVLTGKTPLEDDKRVWIMSYAIILRRVYELSDIEFDLIIVDECHRISNPKAKQSLAMDQLIAKRKLFLSGTPFLNRPIELWHVLNLIDPFSYKSYWAFANKYAGAEKKELWTRQGKRTFWDVSGATNLDELRKRIEPIVIRRTKQEVLDELPELTRTKLDVDISNKREYQSAMLDFKRYLKDNGKTTDPNALSKLNMLRQIIGMGKVDAAVELAEDALLEPDKKIVLYAHHKAVVQALCEKLKDYGVDTIVGDDSNTKRADTMKRFQTQDLPRVLVISSAGGEGVDLFRADTMITVEREWNEAKESQAESRLHRNGQKHAVMVYYLVAHNTIDKDIDELIERKRDAFDSVIGLEDIRTIVIGKGE